LGIVFLFLTRGIIWKKGLSVFLKIFRNDHSTSSENTVSHKQAFFTSVAATVGIGNIAGVGTAIHLGGPGALFWMWMSALFGMFFRMASTYMAIKSRPDDPGSLSFATPMVYLEKYMTGKWRFIPRLVAGLLLIQGVVLYNLVQSNSLAQAVHNRFDIPDVVTALALSLCVGGVILGGLRKIAKYSSIIAPIVIVIFVAAGLLALLSDPVKSLNALGQVFYYAFRPWSIVGGIAGYTVFQALQFGVSRGVFSHMSGMGTSSFLQGANTDTPATGAYMAAITPFVDTIIVCSISGLVILSSPYWQYETGAYLTAASFEDKLGMMGQIVVIVSLIIFAFTTITGFAHISEKCFKYLGGTNIKRFRSLLIIVTFIGPFLNLRFVWSLSDIIIAMIVIFHMLPLLYIILKNRKKMCEDLQSLADDGLDGTARPKPAMAKK